MFWREARLIEVTTAKVTRTNNDELKFIIIVSEIKKI